MVEGLHPVHKRTLSSVDHHGIESGPRPRIAAADPICCTVAIVGAGFGAIGMAIRLKLAEWHDFIILEQADTVGGVWRDNTYPNSAGDIPAHLYSLSFAPSAADALADRVTALQAALDQAQSDAQTAQDRADAERRTKAAARQVRGLMARLHTTWRGQ